MLETDSREINLNVASLYITLSFKLCNLGNVEATKIGKNQIHRVKTTKNQVCRSSFKRKSEMERSC